MAAPETDAKAEKKLLSTMLSAGFAEPQKMRRWLDAPELKTADQQAILAGLRTAASPDTALPSLVRLLDKAPELLSEANKGADALGLYRLLGASSAIGDFLVRRPQHSEIFTGGLSFNQLQEFPSSLLPDTDGEAQIAIAPLDTLYRTEILTALGADAQAHAPVATITGKKAYVELRSVYRRHLAELALMDVTHEDPVDFMPTIGRYLADLAAAALEGALAIARAEVGQSCTPEEVAATRLAIIGMGKCGARELNYISDVDVVYAVGHTPLSELPEGASALTDNELSQVGTELVQALSKAIMAPAPEPALWEVDTNLRPEGKDGALVRTVDSYTSYYKRWAENWEFQALLKARPIAGDPELGARWSRAMRPFIWESVSREGFVQSVQTMRARVTDNIPAAEVDRQIKLGPGGLRDVEFTVQLLQLVHGRTDESVRTQTTTDSLLALSKASFIGRNDAQQFLHDYKFLRTMEHRIQLLHLRRTHLMPAKEHEQRILARSLSSPQDIGALNAESLLKECQKIKRSVRSLHERLFFRPLLAAVAHLSKADVALSEESARDRLAALGYKDPKGAMRHIQALTKGLQRSAEIQRTLMPALLGWFARGVDPDAGLLGFRRVSEALGSTPWYLRMLRDSTAAAERLCTILASSRFVADLIEVEPEAIAWLDRNADLQPREIDTLRQEMQSQLARHTDSASAIRTVRLRRRRELLRIAMGETTGVLDLEAVMRGLSSIDRATIEAALTIVTREMFGQLTAQATDAPDPEETTVQITDVAVIAMGRQGGAEIGYGSDADLMYVHVPHEGVDESQAQSQATAVIARMTALLKQPCKPAIRAERVLEIDADLRPEGKSGPMVRSLESFREYYERWADTWEFQALLRAEPIAGDQQVQDAFVKLINPYRYPSQFTAQQVIEIRRMKARVENERLPRGADRTRQLKLGRGGLSDVEWITQLIQLCCAYATPSLQTTGTLTALHTAHEAGIIDVSDAQVLESAWKLATKIRSGNVLRTGRASDTLGAPGPDVESIARWCGYPPGSARVLEEDYLRLTRRARAVYERLFFDTDFLNR
ncbi:bifunctional [glutamine synthetase] adenylyltransferase/[glutamine synthetase]-adenylyl-L-tyrosine phosphorylase [Rothia sp. ZJ1223]|uniref:bifunctional [glutamine synthetase] adenylyltransferase/[glutamine synthetase]-adenylyl-L-tyrosine phosphorylase n=1 Tax=Rothia sp. ZJ1223 TaxID=2811098 RepID=UPI00351C32F4